jgi:ATP-binding cassette subfamily B protein
VRAVKKLLPFLWPYRWLAAVVLVASIGATAMNLAGPWLIRSVVGIITGVDGAGSAESGRIAWISVALVAAFALRAGFTFLTGYVAHIIAWSFVGDLMVALYGRLQRQSLRYFGERQSGEILTGLIKDTSDMEPFIAHDIPDLIMNLIMFVGIAVILFSLSPALAALTLLPMPLLVFFVMRSGRRMREAFETARDRYGALGALIQDNLAGIKEIQVFTGEDREHGRVSRRAERHTRDRLKANKIEALWVPGVELIAGAGTVIVVYFGGLAALGGSLSIEDMVVFALYLGLFYQPLRLLARMGEGWQEAMTGAQRVCEVLEAEPEVNDPPGGEEPSRTSGRVAFEDVGFEYESGDEVLKDISLEIEPGQTLALVGPTGAGKSTVASLVPRFYDPTRGRVLLDGDDISEMKLKALRDNVSMVLQDVFLFDGTVRENLRFGNEGATDEEIVAAAKAADAHEFIEAMPDGYDTRVGERGARLSGGQKQRLAIARAVLKDAPVLILDEATSAVDMKTEAGIQGALDELMRDRTSIVIAHRLSTIRKADVIAVLENGRVAELGSHEELMLRGGLYRGLHDRQFEVAA